MPQPKPCTFCTLIKGLVYDLFFNLVPSIKLVYSYFASELKLICSGEKRPRRRHVCCTSFGHPSFFRPDPMIYDQYYLMSLGLAVSWQNPDIEILQNGVPVASAYDLQPSTTYTIPATIYNASTTGVVYQMPVIFSCLSFGIATVSTIIPGPIPTVNLGVKGTLEGIAVAEMEWTTPAVPGHYCVQVSFAWPDDANPNNNLGQENTQVVQAQSPAKFTFQLRNAERTARQFRFELDTFAILAPPTCPTTPPPASPAGVVSGTTRARNSIKNNPVPAGWTVELYPPEPMLAPGEGIEIQGSVTPPDDFHGSIPININSSSGNALVGGLTLIVNRA
jgi:hypothetical protein